MIGAPCERNTETKGNAKNVMNQSRLLHSRLVDGNVQMREEYARNAFVGTLKHNSPGNAWPARPGNRRMHSWQNMQGHKPHFILFVRRASKRNSVVSARRARTKLNFLPRRGDGHAMAVECVWIVRVKSGAGGNAGYARYSKQPALLNHGWRCIVLVMVTKSAATARNPIPRRSISKAVQRVAATQAKVAVRAAQETKARAIADVWAAIATRKRNREQDAGQTKEAEPKATQRRQDDGTDMPVADV